MRMPRLPLLLLSLALMASTAHAQKVADTAGHGQLTADDIVDRMGKAERAVLDRVKTYQPLMETYMQNLAPDEARGWVAIDDNYVLGRFDYRDTPTLRPLGRREQKKLIARILGSNPPALGDALATMVTPDWRLLERKRYRFKYVRREFLGEARCFVFDVKPIRDGKDGFVGRIWIEDRDYALVRFNGVNHRTDQTLSSLFKQTLSLHVDSWRVNVAPGVWVPSYVYSEETDLNGALSSRRRALFKSQTRIWGYKAQGPESAGSLTTIRIDEPDVADASEASAQLSPVLSERRWEQEAEANVLERLESAGLLAPPGEADKVLDTVLNNLIVTNALTFDRPLRCRILLTSPLESFTIGRTIVLSRGLIDVLPDEASLATMLAHELSHVVLGHPLIDSKFAFADRLMIADEELLQTLQFHRTPQEEAAADDKEIELLGKSPYRDKLADAGLFLRAVEARSKQLPYLIHPHIGDYVAVNGQTRLAELIQKAPPLMPDNLDQIAALQIGARLIVDPWSGKLTLDRTPAVPLTSVREKAPFAVTPLMPVIRYAGAPDVAAAVRTVGEAR
ncbi:MAG TPA: M48 family metalloprotease [Vicinamibacterales bacterium]|nr:M48 family metalloprotease [Vicinamibacterales bacterium]